MIMAARVPEANKAIQEIRNKIKRSLEVEISKKRRTKFVPKPCVLINKNRKKSRSLNQ